MPWRRQSTAQRLISLARVFANPAALILSTAQLMEWLYQRTREPACLSTAQQLRDGVAGAIGGGTHTADLGGTATTSSFAKAVIVAMRKADIAA